MTPSATSTEYLRNYGVRNAGAISAWNTGATGAGVTVGVVDTGIQFAQADLAGRISSLSTDVVVGRNTPEGVDNHGTFISGVIAAGFNGFGTVGVAYESTILSIRADISDCEDDEDDFCFRSGDLARALDYAVANGARIVNLSLGGDGPLGGTFEAALRRAIDAGVVFAVSSGNDSEANPSWPGRYATDPRFAGGIIVVGAHNAGDTMADFSNKAGVSATGYLSAPGVDILSNCSTTSCFRGSGTSFSSPAVAGALALLLDAFPNLTGRQAIDILLTTARDAGDPGTDTVYGRGLLDITRAFQPVGATSSPTAEGEPIQVTIEPGSSMGQAFGDSLRDVPGLQTIGYDAYDRLFRLDLGAAYPTAPRRSYQPANPTATQQARLSLPMPDGTSLNLIAVTEAPEVEPSFARFTPFDAPWLGAEARQETMLNVTAGRYAFSAWQGQGGARSPFKARSGDAFSALANADHAVRGAVAFGPVTLTAETGAGDRTALLRQVERDASSYVRTALDWRWGRGGLNLSFGSLDEKMGPLGAYMPLDSDFVLPSKTGFTSVGGDVRLSSTAWLSGEVGLGRSEIDGRFLDLDGAAVSSTWRAALTTACPAWAPSCSSLTWEVSQPLRIEDGTFTARLADVPLEYFDPVTFSTRRFSASPSGRQLDYALRSLHRLPDGSALQLEAVATTQEQHRRDAALAYALLASWRRGF